MNLFSDVMASPSPASPSGATGTTGPQGTQGIQGLQGFSGLGVINETKLYYTIGNMAQSNLTNTGSSQAVCDLGNTTSDIAIGGNYGIWTATTGINFLVTFHGNTGLDTYRTEIENHDTEPGSIEFVTTVLCFDNPPLRP
ncbi:MAG TPA: hypothetical protein VIY98_07560 [Nitrososphaeraceae archaeon]